MLNTKVADGVNKKDKGITLNVTGKDGKAEALQTDILLVAIGRHAFTGGLQLDKAGLSTNDRGQVEINEHWQTKVPGIYAIGDAVPG